MLYGRSTVHADDQTKFVVENRRKLVNYSILAIEISLRKASEARSMKNLNSVLYTQKSPPENNPLCFAAVSSSACTPHGR